MFYCKPCGEKNKWPVYGRDSYGKCEVCGETANCFDVPSAALPETKRIETHITDSAWYDESTCLRLIIDNENTDAFAIYHDIAGWVCCIIHDDEVIYRDNWEKREDALAELIRRTKCL